MNHFENIKQDYADYLTFYHECRIPKHTFFDIDANQNNEKLLVVSSPSRMGNHLVMSMLDGHPSLPSVPGEDGFHMFSFTQANYNIHSYMGNLRSSSNVENLMNIASSGGGSKWRQFSELGGDKECRQKGYSGVGGHKQSAIMDFENTVFEVNFLAYEKYLIERGDSLRSAERYNEILVAYTRALGELNQESRKTAFDSYIVHGAMRTQLLWLCKTMPNVKILSSIRSFPSYAVTFIKSRYGDVKITTDSVQEAWEHWFHKVIDMIYLRLYYPDQFGLVTFDDLVCGEETTRAAICDFLEVGHSDALSSATIMGIPVRGNSWKSRISKQSGQFYKPARYLDSELVPDEASKIWELAEQVKLN